MKNIDMEDPKRRVENSVAVEEAPAEKKESVRETGQEAIARIKDACKSKWAGLRSKLSEGTGWLAKKMKGMGAAAGTAMEYGVGGAIVGAKGAAKGVETGAKAVAGAGIATYEAGVGAGKAAIRGVETGALATAGAVIEGGKFIGRTAESVANKAAEGYENLKDRGAQAYENMKGRVGAAKEKFLNWRNQKKMEALAKQEAGLLEVVNPLLKQLEGIRQKKAELRGFAPEAAAA